MGVEMGRGAHRVHTEWHRPLSGVHSIMMEKSAPPGESGGTRLPPFTISTITDKVVVYAPAERAYTISTIFLFLIYPYMYSVGGQAGPSIHVGWGGVGEGNLLLMMMEAVTPPCCSQSYCGRSQSCWSKPHRRNFPSSSKNYSR